MPQGRNMLSIGSGTPSSELTYADEVLEKVDRHHIDELVQNVEVVQQ